MLNNIGGSSLCAKWSRAKKITNYLFHTKVCGDRKDLSASFPSLDFASKYNKETTDQILDVLNKSTVEELARYNISKARMQKMEKYRRMNGPFGTIQQLLQVDDFGVKVVEKLVESITKGSSKRSAETNHRIPPKLLNSVTMPVLTKEQRCAIGTVTSFWIDMKYISWAKMDSNIRLLSWDSYKFDWSKKDDPMQLHNLALIIRDQLPASDAYVTEEISSQQTATINVASTNVFLNLKRLQLTSMLVTLIATQFDSSKGVEGVPLTSLDNCFFLRRQVTAQLFRLVVGGETVSANSVISQIIDDTINQSLAHIPQIMIDAPEIDAFERSDLLEKEALSQALLMSVAFVDLALNRNPLSFTAIARKSKIRMH